MLPVLVERALLYRPAAPHPVCLNAPNPGLPCFGNGGGLGWRRVDALADVLPHFIMPSLCVLLSVVGLDVTVSIPVDVVDDPVFPDFTLRCFPCAFAHRHASLLELLAACRTMSHKNLLSSRAVAGTGPCR